MVIMPSVMKDAQKLGKKKLVFKQSSTRKNKPAVRGFKEGNWTFDKHFPKLQNHKNEKDIYIDKPPPQVH